MFERNRKPVEPNDNIEPLVERALEASLRKMADLALLTEGERQA